MKASASRNCTLCVYATREPAPGIPEIGNDLYVCQRMPPSPVLIPTGPASANLTAHFPIVHAGIVCGEYRAGTGTENGG